MKGGRSLALAAVRPRLASIRSPIDDLLLPRLVLCLNLDRERPLTYPSLWKQDWPGWDQELVELLGELRVLGVVIWRATHSFFEGRDPLNLLTEA